VAEFQVVKLEDMPGFFHKPDWYQPLLFGENLRMSVTYLLPGAGISTGSTPESAEFLETAIYMLEGRLDVTRDGKKYELVPRMAMLIPLQPGPRVEIKNSGDRAASFVRVYSPPPHPDLNIHSLQRLEQLYRDANRPVKTGQEMKEVIAAKKP
jgi:mannose-6-phosphate isomerase-like protein (cupin superfamily)